MGIGIVNVHSAPPVRVKELANGLLEAGRQSAPVSLPEFEVQDPTSVKDNPGLLLLLVNIWRVCPDWGALAVFAQHEIRKEPMTEILKTGETTFGLTEIAWGKISQQWQDLQRRATTPLVPRIHDREVRWPVVNPNVDCLTLGRNNTQEIVNELLRSDKGVVASLRRSRELGPAVIILYDTGEILGNLEHELQRQIAKGLATSLPAAGIMLTTPVTGAGDLLRIATRGDKELGPTDLVAPPYAALVALSKKIPSSPDWTHRRPERYLLSLALGVSLVTPLYHVFAFALSRWTHWSFWVAIAAAIAFAAITSTVVYRALLWRTQRLRDLWTRWQSDASVLTLKPTGIPLT